MSNEWNGNNPRIWETPPLPGYAAASSMPSNFYAGAPSTSYYNAPAHQPQEYQHPSQMVSGYSFDPTAHSSSNSTQQDASMILQAVNTLNQSLGGLDIDPALINALSRHIQHDRATDDKPEQPEIYSPTFNSPSPSPERKPSKESLIEVNGKKLVSSRPFYEQFNHYEDEPENDTTSRVDQFLLHSSRQQKSRSPDRRSRVSQERTWAGSASPSPPRRDARGSPLRLGHRRSRSPLSHRARQDRPSHRAARSRSPLRKSRSRSRESSRANREELNEKVVNLLGMSKNENRKFTSAQQTSSVLLVMNLDNWITDKVLWGAIHKYARDFGTKPPFYIERASFHLSKDKHETFLGLIAFTTVSAAEMCMMHTKCELEVTGRQKKTFKMMYYTENTIMFEALGYKFAGLWRAVIKKRAELRAELDDSPQDHDKRERKRDNMSEDRTSPPNKDVTKSDGKPDESTPISHSTENEKTTGERGKDLKTTKLVECDSVENKSSPKHNENESTETALEDPSKNVQKSKPQANIIKTNVLIGKMKSYLIKQNKTKDDDIIKIKIGEISSIKPDSVEEDKSKKKEINRPNKIPDDPKNSVSKTLQNSKADIKKSNCKNPNEKEHLIKNVKIQSHDHVKTDQSQGKAHQQNKNFPEQKISQESGTSLFQGKNIALKHGGGMSGKNTNPKEKATASKDSGVPTVSSIVKSLPSERKVESTDIKGKVTKTESCLKKSLNKPTIKKKSVEEKEKDSSKIDTSSDKTPTKKTQPPSSEVGKSSQSNNASKVSNIGKKTNQVKEKPSETTKTGNEKLTKDIPPVSSKKIENLNKEKIIVIKSDSTPKHPNTSGKSDIEKMPSTSTKNDTHKKDTSSKDIKQPPRKLSKDQSIENENTNKKEIDQSKNNTVMAESVEKDKESKKEISKPQKKSSVDQKNKNDGKNTNKKDIEQAEKKQSTVQNKVEQSQKKEVVDQPINKSKQSESGIKSINKRKLSPKRENSRNVKQRNDKLDDINMDIDEDPDSARRREEEEAELFGKRLDKYSGPKNKNQSREFNDRGFRGRNFDRQGGSPYRQERGVSREDRFGREDRRRGGFRGRPHWEHQDKRRRGDQESFDDIDGNEDDYWTKKREVPQKSSAVNPWIQQETGKIGLSLKELKDPEFLLRVLLQTSIMIQNNQLTMANPLDSLTPTDKELIIETLNEIEATSQVIIYATVNDKNKFNAAEHRVLIEALSNIHMFKAALLPPGSLDLKDTGKHPNDEYSKHPCVDVKQEKPEVYVQMTSIKKWVNKDQIIKHLRKFNLKFDQVEINPCLKNEPFTEGFIKFRDLESASELLKRTNRVLYLGEDSFGIQLNISAVTRKTERWTCNSCSMRNSCDTLICQKCQKLKEKLKDVNVTTEVTNKLALINFKKTTSVAEIKQILTKIAPFLNCTVSAHIDSTSDQVVHFLIELPNPQASSMLKKCIRDHMEEFSSTRAGPRVAISFVVAGDSSKNKVYTFADVPRLAHYSASLYATNEDERMKYYNHYTTLYTQELIQGKTINVVLPEDNTSAPQVTGPPTGTDDRTWPSPNTAAFTYDQNSGYYYDYSTGLYYEASSQYFYNMETGKFLHYDSTRSTYVLVQSSEISSAPVKSTPDTSKPVIPSQSPQDSLDDQSAVKTNAPKESKIHAKKVMKDLEKWSKSVNKLDKRKAAPNSLNLDMDSADKPCPADVGFDILRRTETSMPSISSVPSISSLIMDNHIVCEDEEEEYGHIDWKNITCNLCHRVFNNTDILNKHSKLSELHIKNLKQWYISKNLDPNNEERRKQQYRDRAAECRNKIVGKSETKSNSPAESWLCNTPGCMAYKRSGFDTCISCEKEMAWRGPSSSATHHAPNNPDLSVGSQLLKKMGWESGTGLGKMGQGTMNPINVERQSGYSGLGAQKQEFQEDGESYVSYIKRNTQKRFKQLSRKY